jgi:diguanylate cyclase (GGDEF)-like protein
MHIDLPTLVLATAFVAFVAGLLLLFSWFQNRDTPSLALWGVGYLLGSVGGTLIAARAHISPFWSIEIGNSLAALAYAMMWSGARSFEGRKPQFTAAIAGAAFWFVLCQFDWFMASQHLRIVVFSAMVVAYTLLTASEFLHPRNPELMSRWPAIVLLLIHSGMFAVRIVLVDVLPFPGGTSGYSPGWIPIGPFLLLLYQFCMAFLVVNMVKERMELEHRQASLVDPLTGVPNRRAFLDRAERQLRRMTAEGRTASLLVLDLDLFKQINDSFGHQVGDRVLCAFCDTALGALRPHDLFGRLGGEEFACLLPDATVPQAMQAAERIRAQFEGRPAEIGVRAASASTVSIGVASTADVGDSLTALLAAADRALYQAKAKGRNRVEVARTPPAVVPAHAAAG